VCLAIIAKG